MVLVLIFSLNPWPNRENTIKSIKTHWLTSDKYLLGAILGKSDCCLCWQCIMLCTLRTTQCRVHTLSIFVPVLFSEFSRRDFNTKLVQTLRRGEIWLETYITSALFCNNFDMYNMHNVLNLLCIVPLLSIVLCSAPSSVSRGNLVTRRDMKDEAYCFLLT